MTFPVEQPPSNTPPVLSEYLVRMYNNINNEFTRGITVSPQTTLPVKPVTGMIRFFSVAILPDILGAGLYGYDGTKWKAFQLGSSAGSGGGANLPPGGGGANLPTNAPPNSVLLTIDGNTWIADPILVSNVNAALHRTDSLQNDINNLFAASPQNWVSQDYPADSVVAHNGKFWLARNDQKTGQEPGVHAGWADITLEALWHKANNTSSGSAGPTGPTGPTGPPGPHGPAGADGAPGVKGDQGIAGPAGPVGPQGPPGSGGSSIGPTGPTGPKGDPGPKGDAGVDGAVGPAGVKGDAGSAGTPGVKGDIGPAGSVGPAGPLGPTGPTGATGASGTIGPAGPAGNDGAQGVKGDAGPAGSAGPKGDAGVKGDAGSIGVKGDTGPTGPTGADGAVGPKGDAGVAGSVGPKGDAGAQGTPGVAGLTGPTGPTGANGLQGAKGDPGPAGSVGPKGDAGVQGIPGTVGPAGSDGAAGVKGDQGIAGPAGPTGPTGPPGSKGDAGTAGAAGPAGSVGPAGTAGSDGILSIDSLPIVSGAIHDLDEFPIFDHGTSTNKKSIVRKIWDYISDKLASPPAIGGTTPAAGTFTTVHVTAHAKVSSSADVAPWQASVPIIEMTEKGSAIYSNVGGYIGIVSNCYYNGAWKYAISGRRSVQLYMSHDSLRTQTATVTGVADAAITYVAGPSLLNGGNSWTNGASDERQKKNFYPAPGLSALLPLNPTYYNFIWDEDTVPRRLGFIAQNVRNTIPEMVVEKDELAPDGTPYLTLTPDYILPVLVKSIQELHAEIESLKKLIIQP